MGSFGILGCLGMLRKVFKCFGMSWDVFGCLERRWQRLGMFKMCFDEPKNPLKLGCLKGCSWFMGWFGILGCLGMSFWRTKKLRTREMTCIGSRDPCAYLKIVGPAPAWRHGASSPAPARDVITSLTALNALIDRWIMKNSFNESWFSSKSNG